MLENRFEHQDAGHARQAANNLLSFLDRSPCSYHAVAAIVEELTAAGFVRILPDGPFVLASDGKYFMERHGSAVVAFIPGTCPPSRGGFHLIGAHTDSPCLKLKPRPEQVSHGLAHLGIEVYGQPILASWMDRELGFSGRVILSPDGRSIESRLFKTDRPFLTIPNLAVHFNRKVNEEGLLLNPQSEIRPLLASVLEEPAPVNFIRPLIAKGLEIDEAAIVDFDLVLYDPQPASFGGLNDEFIRSGRLDDLSMCHAALMAIQDAGKMAAEPTRLAVFYDSEEVGSQTAQGARSNLLPSVLERLALALGDDRDGYFRALSRSLLISADNAHAVHPGYADETDPDHGPHLNGGPVVKLHAGRAYATDAYSAAVFELACRRASVPCQRFVNRSDRISGTTIGSMTSTQLGIPTVDVGNPELAMHSIRELAGTHDHLAMIKAMTTFYSD